MPNEKVTILGIVTLIRNSDEQAGLGFSGLGLGKIPSPGFWQNIDNNRLMLTTLSFMSSIAR